MPTALSGALACGRAGSQLPAIDRGLPGLVARQQRADWSCWFRWLLAWMITQWRAAGSALAVIRWVIESLIVYQRRDRRLPKVDSCVCPRPVDGIAVHPSGAEPKIRAVGL